MSDRRPPWVRFYPDRWLSSERIAELTPAQEGIYWRLCALQAQGGDRGLPGDLAGIERLCKRDASSADIALVVEAFFPIDADGRRRSPLMAEAVQIALEWQEGDERFREAQAERGRKSGQARRAKSNRGSNHGSAPVRTAVGTKAATGDEPSPSPESRVRSTPDPTPPQTPPGGFSAQAGAGGLTSVERQELAMLDGSSSRGATSASDRVLVSAELVEELHGWWQRLAAAGRVRPCSQWGELGIKLSDRLNCQLDTSAWRWRDHWREALELIEAGARPLATTCDLGKFLGVQGGRTMVSLIIDGHYSGGDAAAGAPRRRRRRANVQ